MKLRKSMHGEVVIKEVRSIPEGAVEVKVDANYIVVGQSETTGNDHRIAVKEKVSFFEKDGILYMKNEVPTDVYCPNADKHTASVLPPAIWATPKRREFDYVEMVVRKVRD